jgi:hypothetical protein
MFWRLGSGFSWLGVGVIVIIKRKVFGVLELG